jgi:hypothetical protein
LYFDGGELIKMVQFVSYKKSSLDLGSFSQAFGEKSSHPWHAISGSLGRTFGRKDLFPSVLTRSIVLTANMKDRKFQATKVAPIFT